MILNQISHSAEQTIQLGSTLGKILRGGDVVCLSGDLGAGKTALATGIGKGWGALEPVNSPTFVLIHEHRRQQDTRRLYHLDCYRLSSLDDAATIGIEDILASDDIIVIEWPERITPLLPAERLWINLEEGQDAMDRLLSFEAVGTQYELLLETFQGHLNGSER
jgi:tRNA threonylcarbamoyladenosine biosynthesis protein TsaE